MNLLMKSFVVVLLFASVGSAQEKKKGFEFLKQFEGTWWSTSEAPSVEEAEQRSKIECQMIGEFWLVNQHSGKFGETDFKAVQTIGYDKSTEKFTGTWIDSVKSYTWKYEGQLDESNRLVLKASGPDWQDDSKMRDYRDIYEFESADEIKATSQMKGEDGKWSTFMTARILRPNVKRQQTVTPFLMYYGKAKEAMNYYESIFSDFNSLEVSKYGPNESGKESTVRLAKFEISGQKIMCIDSPPVHDFTFTPAVSLFVQCESKEQLSEYFSKLKVDGKVMMPIGSYGFSDQFAWVSDKFGVSWQLNLESLEEQK